MLVFPYGFGSIPTGGSGGSGGLSMRTLTYTGTGAATNTITFPKTPTVVFGIATTPGSDSRGYSTNCDGFIWSEENAVIRWTGAGTGTAVASIAYNGNAVTLSGSDMGIAMNVSGAEYTVYYTTDTGSSNDITMVTYTGDGTIPKTFTFDTAPSQIIGVYGPGSAGYEGHISWGVLEWGDTTWQYMYKTASGSTGQNQCSVTYPDDTTISINTPASGDAAGCMNRSGGSYTMWYM